MRLFIYWDGEIMKSYSYEEMISKNYGVDVNLDIGIYRQFKLLFDVNFEKWDHNPSALFNFTTPLFDFNLHLYNIHHVDEEE